MSVIMGIIMPFFIFAQTPSIADLRRELAEENAAYAALIKRLEKAEMRANQPKIIVTDSAAKDAVIKPVSLRRELPTASVLITNKGVVRPNGTWIVDHGTGTVTGCVPEENEHVCYIVTAAHVIQNARELSISIFDSQNKPYLQFRPEIMIIDAKNDIAVLRIHSPRELPVAAIASKNYKSRRGEYVTAVGSPRGAIPHIYTGPKEYIKEVNKYNGFENISISCPSESGASGGGVFNAQGQLIAICSASDATTNIHTGIQELYDLIDRANAGIAISSGSIIKKEGIIDTYSYPIFAPAQRR